MPSEHESEEVDEDELPDACQEALSLIKSYSTKPGRIVFVEDGNCDGWISTDETVEIAE